MTEIYYSNLLLIRFFGSMVNECNIVTVYYCTFVFKLYNVSVYNC